MTLENFKNRGFEVVGGTLEEAPYLYFSADLQVYNDGKLGKMYQVPINHGHEYPNIYIGGMKRQLHVVVAVMRSGKYPSLAAFDEYCATQLRDFGVTIVVRHEDGVPKSNFWAVSIGNQSGNMTDAVREGTIRTNPVEIRVGERRDSSEIWKYDGVREAVFSSRAEAARALKDFSDMKDLAASIAYSANKGGYFSLKNGVKAWAFAV
jgi:hypothetical protein